MPDVYVYKIVLLAQLFFFIYVATGSQYFNAQKRFLAICKCLRSYFFFSAH